MVEEYKKNIVKRKSINMVYPKHKLNKRLDDYYESRRFKLPTSSHDLYDSLSLESTLARDISKLKQVDKNLEKAQELNRKKVVELDQAWHELARKQLKFRHEIMKFETFVRANADKRARARQKMDEERYLNRLNCLQISQLHKEMILWHSYKDRKEDSIKSYRIYENYLDSLIETKEFSSISAILKRYDALQVAKKHIHEDNDNLLQQYETRKQTYLEMLTTKYMRVIELSVINSNLCIRHDNAIHCSLKWEVICSHIKERLMNLEQNLQVIKSSTEFIYKDICHHTNTEYDPKLPLEYKLVCIKERMGVMNHLTIQFNLRNEPLLPTVSRIKAKFSRKKKIRNLPKKG